MKYFLAVDLEGATGVVHHDQLMPDGRGYAAAQRWLTGDINAAIRGICAADAAAEIVVGDGHGIMRNVLLDELDERAMLVVGPGRYENKPLCQCEGIDASFDVGMLIGFHTRAGTPGGLLAHTFVGSTICDLSLNGRVAGEAEIDAAIMASYGVPVGLIVGNSDLEPEVRAWDPTVTFYATKTTLGPTAGICKTPRRTASEIEEIARQVVERRLYSLRENPATTTLTATLYRREMLDRAATVNGVHVVDDRTFSVTHANAAEAFRMFWNAITRTLEDPQPWLK
ncbi:MAG: M55 family metallopeptidase [Bacteroidetes bacterium]|nr:M55 family metallopeptidase [Bacteroidota bacterium]